MSGFDNGNSQGIVSSGQQFGPILRGYGPPVPQAGADGAIYIDVQTFQLFEKRGGDVVDPWGHYIFVVPVAFQQSLNYFGTSAPGNDLGTVGDYYLQWAGYPNYGINPVVWGPKQWSGWPQNGDGPGTVIAASGGGVLQVGLLAEGATLTDQQPTQLIATGLLAEITVPVPVTANVGDTVGQLGLQSTGTIVNVTPNARYTAVDQFAVP